MTLEELVGQHLMIGIPGKKVTPEIVHLFRQTHAGGLIVFRPNFESAKSFKKLISDLESALDRRLLVAVDHEGGRVIHLAEGITVFPDNLACGMIQNVDYARRQGAIEAKELRRLGIDLNLAPTLDVLTDTFSPNIGSRSYGRDPDLVARLGCARIQAMQAGGLSACAKHFPGQGHSSVDAHLGLPVLPATWDEMRKIHIRPFVEAIKAGVDSIMSSHPVYPHLEPSKVPATFSTPLIRDCLRGELGFEGVILSDDLEMGALKHISTIGESAFRAVKAGHDIVLVCHDPNGARGAFQALLEAYRKKKLRLNELEASSARIERLKRKERFTGEKPFPEAGGARVAKSIARDAIRISLDQRPIPEINNQSFPVIFPRLSELSDRILIESEMLDEESFIRKTFKPRIVLIVGINPDKGEIEQARSLSRRSDAVIFFCYDAHLYPGCRKLLEVIQSVARQCIVVFLRDPYDSEWIKEGTPCINAFGFRSVQINAVAEVICRSGRKKPIYSPSREGYSKNA